MSSSGENATINEKEAIIEFLKLYRDLPCLWNTSIPSYGNKETRRNAYEQLLERYKIIDETATTISVKKKIENLRTSYRREFKKNVHSLMKGQVRKSSLWYFDHMKFLDSGALKLKFTNEGSEDISTIDNDGIDMEDDEDGGSSSIKRELVENFNNISSVYVTENLDSEDEDQDHSFAKRSRNSYTIPVSPVENASDAFGKAIGLQLKELDPEQRYIAEKLMSEIIYYGRFHKLNITTRLSNV